MTQPEPKAPVETEDEHGKGQRAIVSRYVTEINLYEKKFNEAYYDLCDSIISRYRNMRTELDKGLIKANLLWSGMNLMLPSTYSKRAKTVVKRRFNDRDPVARMASELLERAVETSNDDDTFDPAMDRCNLDFSLLARGQAWIRYEGEIVEKKRKTAEAKGKDKPLQVSDDAKTEEKESKKTYSDLVDEYLCTDYVHRRDYGHNAGGRNESEIYLKWRKAYMTRRALVKRFGEKGKNVPLNVTSDLKSKEKDGKELSDEHFSRAAVYEIWDLTERKIYWICKDYGDGPLDVREDFLKLQGFFPCPEPAYGTLTNDDLIPSPDAAMAQCLYEEVDNLTTKISDITEMIKVVGGCDANATELVRMLKSPNGTIIPVSGWAERMEAGGHNSLWEVVDITPFVSALQSLYLAREQAKQLLYEVTGQSDILRGATDPRETLGAQELKQGNASKRIDQKRERFAKFVRDVIAIKAEIIAEHFEPETIKLMAGAEELIAQKMPKELQEPPQPPPPPPPQQMQLPPGMSMSQGGTPPGAPPPGAGGPPGAPMPQDPMMQYQQAQMAYQQGMQKWQMDRQAWQAEQEELVEQAIELLRGDTLRRFRVDVETDSTVAPDEQQAKADSVELAGAVTTFFEKAFPLAAANPALGDFFKEFLLLIFRNHRAGRPLEESLEESLDEAFATFEEQQKQGPPPDPKMVEAQNKLQVEMEKLKLSAQEAQQKMELERQKMALEAEKMQHEMQIKMAEFKADMQIEQQKLMADLLGKQQERQMKKEEAAQDMEFRAQEMSQEHQFRAAEMSHEQQVNAQDRAFDQQERRETAVHDRTMREKEASLSEEQTRHKMSLAEEQTKAKEQK